jgi:hypothetical protein
MEGMKNLFFKFLTTLVAAAIPRIWVLIGRGDWIRTSDPLHPMQMR